MDSKQPKICFLADRHGLFDDRIYWKQAVSLRSNGFEIHYILAGDKENSGITNEGIYYQIIKRRTYHKNRLLNFLIRKILPGNIYSEMLQKAKEVAADAYHIHDLRVNLIGRKLKNLPHQPKVIYDIHEPYPENITDYFTGPEILYPLIAQYAAYIKRWEKKCAEVYDLIITTEENMQQRFRSYFPEKPVEIIYNYTNLPAPETIGENEKTWDALYTGGITKRRGAMKILEAIGILKKDQPDFKMLFLGTWFPQDLKDEMEQFIRQNNLDKNVELLDSVPYREVDKYYRKSRIGMGIFLPIPTHRIILQIKIFEYMNFGLPIVGSNFGHIQKIIEKHQCGMTVDPEDPASIAAALNKLTEDRDLYNKQSQNGREAAQQHYRWELMEEKLVELYRKLLINCS